MSAKDRAEKAMKATDARRQAAESEGMRQALDSPDGRALISWMTREALAAEGPGSRMLRAFGRDIMLAATLANWDGVQIMREEWEKPRLGTRAEAEEEDDGRDQ
jgi:hypothetical protein